MLSGDRAGTVPFRGGARSPAVGAWGTGPVSVPVVVGGDGPLRGDLTVPEPPQGGPGWWGPWGRSPLSRGTSGGGDLRKQSWGPVPVAVGASSAIRGRSPIDSCRSPPGRGRRQAGPGLVWGPGPGWGPSWGRDRERGGDGPRTARVSGSVLTMTGTGPGGDRGGQEPDGWVRRRSGPLRMTRVVISARREATRSPTALRSSAIGRLVVIRVGSISV